MKRNNYFIYPILLIIEIALCLKSDLFNGNISGYIDNIYTYIFVLVFGILLGFSFAIAVRNIVSNNLCILLVISSILPVLIPYSSSDNLISSIHILFAYIGFGLLTSISMFIIYQLSLLSVKFKKIFKIYILMLMIILTLDLYFLAVNNLMELIYLSTTTIIYGYIYLNCNSFTPLDCN